MRERERERVGGQNDRWGRERGRKKRRDGERLLRRRPLEVESGEGGRERSGEGGRGGGVKTTSVSLRLASEIFSKRFVSDVSYT